MNVGEGVLAVWAVIALLALARAWGDPGRRRVIVGAVALLAAAGAAATGLLQFTRDTHEWTEVTLALGGMSGTIILSCIFARKSEEAGHGK